METSPFVNNSMTSRTVDRSLFLSLLTSKRLISRSYLSKNYGTINITTEDERRLKSFLNNIVKKVEIYKDHIEKIHKSRKTYDFVKGSMIRACIMGPSETKIKSEVAGDVLITNSINKYTRFKNMVKTMTPYIGDDGTTLFCNYKHDVLVSLMRCRRTFADVKMSTFSNPFAMYLEMIETSLGREHPTTVILRFISSSVLMLSSKCDGVAYLYIDDVIRQFLSEIDKESFLLCQINSTLSLIMTNVHGLSTLGGPRGWSKEQVVQQIMDWVTVKEEKIDCLDIPFVRDKFREWMRSWCIDHGSKLSFSEFCDDPMRWATGGGSKKSEIDGETYRTKWSWAMSNKLNNVDSYTRALAEENVAHVALKEEVKTRTVITTPMASYLRQSYLWFYLGKPKFLRSTLANSTLTNELINSNSKYYICVDASQFDHCISKEFVLYFFKTMVEFSPSEEVKEVCRAEIESLESLTLEYDNRTINYANGLLSGWRFTSLIGSIYSALVCEFVNFTLGRSNNYITQGDDIIMFSNDKIKNELIVDCCSKFGLTTNVKKTTIGTFGEFLKYRYGCGVVQGYASRAVRSIFYANPWLDSTVVTKPNEVTSKWFSVISRVCISANKVITPETYKVFEEWICDDVRSWAGGKLSKSSIREALKSPISVGGLGCWETCGVNSMNMAGGWVKLSVVVENFENGNKKFLSAFGISKGSSNVYTRTYERKIRFARCSDVSRTIKRMYAMTSAEISRPVFSDNVNIFQSIIERVSLCKTVPPIIGELLQNVPEDVKTVDLTPNTPRHLRKTNRWSEVLSWLMGGMKDAAMPPSLFVDSRYDANPDILRTMATVLMYNVRNVTANFAFYMQLCFFNVFNYQMSTIHAL